jgi:hypothetical protein
MELFAFLFLDVVMATSPVDDDDDDDIAAVFSEKVVGVNFSGEASVRFSCL